MKALNIINKRFGNLEVLAEVSKDGVQRMYLTLCDCGELEVKWQSNLTSKRTTRCSLCMNKGRGLVTSQKIEVTCDTCGDSLLRSPSWIKQSTRHFCNSECFGNWAKVNRAGANSHRWQGGITSAYDMRRTSTRYKDWRLSVFERDNFTCQKCGDDKGGNLNAHHISSFNRYPNLQIVLSNGVTLCKRCHVDFHSIYGVTEFTEDDYYRWSYCKRLEDRYGDQA